MFAYMDRLSLSEPAKEFAPPTRTLDAKKDFDQSETVDINVEDYDESQEFDVLKLPIGDIRKAWFNYIVQPVIAAREYAKFLVS
jgi:hypothetical protein